MIYISTFPICIHTSLHIRVYFVPSTNDRNDPFSLDAMANDNNNYDANDDATNNDNANVSDESYGSTSSSHFFTNMIDPLQFSTFLFVLLLLFVVYLLLPRGIRKQYFYAHPKRHAWTARSHSNGSASSSTRSVAHQHHPQQQHQQYHGGQQHASTPIGLQVRSFFVGAVVCC